MRTWAGQRLWPLSCSQSLGLVLQRLSRTSLKSLRCLYIYRLNLQLIAWGSTAGALPWSSPRGPLRQTVALRVLQSLTSQKKQTYRAEGLGSLCRMQKYNRGRRNHQRQWP